MGVRSWLAVVRRAESRLAPIVGAFVALTGCGGGGGGNGATIGFPLARGYAALVAAGESGDFNVSGTCTGTATLTSNPATAGIFEGEPVYTIADARTWQLSGCGSYTPTVNWTDYYDLNYALAGSTSAVSSAYGVVPTPRDALPDTAHVGDAGARDTEIIYTDSGKTVVNARSDRSYVVEPDGPDTAIVNFIVKEYDASGRLIETVQSRYRIDAAGTMTKISVDYQWSTISTTHLLLTRSR